MAKTGLDAQGRQLLREEWLEPEKIRSKINKPGQSYLQKFDVVISDVVATRGMRMLQCKCCKKEFSVSNPHKTAQHHTPTKCKPTKQQREQRPLGVDEQGAMLLASPDKNKRPAESSAGSPIAGKRAHVADIRNFGITATQKTTAIKHYARHLCVRNKAFTKVLLMNS